MTVGENSGCFWKSQFTSWNMELVIIAADEKKIQNWWTSSIPINNFQKANYRTYANPMNLKHSTK